MPQNPSGARVLAPDGVRRSPNIWDHPRTYELENHAVDPDGVIEAAMAEVRDWAGASVLDIGCGSGFHLPALAERAARVVGVEPHPPLLELARRRTARLANVQVRAGRAQDLPVPDASVDIAQARWAYFFGLGGEPGLRELDRVMRRGGAAFVVDVDPTRSAYGGWFRAWLPEYDPVAVQRFWALHGWSRTELTLRWVFASREDLEAVVRIELPPEVAEQALAGHPGLEVDYAANLWWRRY
jgi:ubiquinone/menaquinone biosynthesis C-methylase UbiE